MTTTIVTPPPPLIGGGRRDLTGVECRILRASLGLERRHVARFIETLDLAPGAVDTTFERINAWIARLTAWEKAKGRGYPGALVQALTALEDAVEAWARQAASEAGGEGEAVLYRPLGARHAFALLELDRYGLRLTPDQIAALDNPNGEIWLALADAAIARAALYLRFWPIGGPRSVTRVELDREPDGPIRPDPARQSAPVGIPGYPQNPTGETDEEDQQRLEAIDALFRNRSPDAARDAVAARHAITALDKVSSRDIGWAADLLQVAATSIGPENAEALVSRALSMMGGLSVKARVVAGRQLTQALTRGRFTAAELFSLADNAKDLAAAIALEMNGGAPGTVTIDIRADIPARVITQALLRPDPAA